MRKTKHPDLGRAKARRLYKELGNCEHCGKPATDRHHIDGDTQNNRRGNIAMLCRKCHMLADGRLDALHSAEIVEKKRQPPKACSNCGRFVKPLRKGRCHSCNEYVRRNGIERPYLADGRSEKSAEARDQICGRCKRPVSVAGYAAKGLCKSCYRYVHYFKPKAK